MGAIVGLFLFTVLCTIVGGVQGVCRHVENDDMIEYSCTGGQLSDLNDLPESTGKIRITNMPIQRITADTFSRFGSELWVLGCSYCDIIDIEPGAFQNLNNLQQLSLVNNHLTTVKESWFRGLDYLTYLDLNYNNIQSIEEGVFRNLPSLVELRLSGNRLECLNLMAISQLKDLKRMFLTENSEFKCPNAVSEFLESRGVNLEKDPEWSRLQADLVPVELPYEYDTYDEETTTEQSITPLPPYRERLHPVSLQPFPTATSTASYVPPRFQTTEEVVFRPVYATPDWRTTTRASMSRYEDRTPEATTDSPYDYTRRPPYVPPTIAPVDPAEYPPPKETEDVSQDVTTLRSWPNFQESTSSWPAYPVYPSHRNEDKHYTEQPDYPSPTDSFPLAAGPSDSHQTPSYVGLHPEQVTDPLEVYGSQKSTVPLNAEYYSPNIESRQQEYQESSMDSPTTRIIQPFPPFPTAMVHPASPDNAYQPPYYEHPVTVHAPPLGNNQPQQEEMTPIVVAVETTTDKPLPDCPTRNSSSFNQSSLGTMIVALVFLVFTRHVVVEGF